MHFQILHERFVEAYADIEKTMDHASRLQLTVTGKDAELRKKDAEIERLNSGRRATSATSITALLYDLSFKGRRMLATRNSPALPNKNLFLPRACQDMLR